MPKENKQVVETATGVLVLLWKEGFFRESRKIDDTVKKLSKKGYNFPHTNVDKALRRSSYLTKKGKRGSYEYIQKYPYMSENNDQTKSI